MFYWLFYTTASVTNYTERPLLVWLQGGPGRSSTGEGNFDVIGPLDLSLQKRDYTWVNNFNVLFVDSPVGTGFSYVEDLKYLTETNDEIALDFVELMKGFYRSNPEFERVPLYIFGQSYGGKMAIDIGIRMSEAERAGTIKSNLLGVAMGNALIHPVDAILSWGPMLLAAGLVDQEGYEHIQESAREAERLFNAGFYVNSTMQWSQTQQAVFRRTTRVDFYNIFNKIEVFSPYSLSAYEIARDTMIRDMPYTSTRQQLNLTTLMNTKVKEALRIPEKVVWESQRSDVYDKLRADFMKPVTERIEKLLNETNIIVMKCNGNLDIICNTPGQLAWVDRLKWSGAEEYRNTERRPIWENNRLEGYYKSFRNFRFFWINAAGHVVASDNPAGANAFLRDMTSFG
ncbi:retinoid-inducible serine carboxypeptidase-like [Pararge aegeria]|uniref:retinoid-inducible serine carboxypeptidase-like n=1 Tax=Pararge aegeria TaxID=116150 RepID=UPI0019D094DE|nr:retinoid-inducible serine carboxypeptidase-like [Pararge aegeria]